MPWDERDRKGKAFGSRDSVSENAGPRPRRGAGWRVDCSNRCHTHDALEDERGRRCPFYQNRETTPNKDHFFFSFLEGAWAISTAENTGTTSAFY